MMKCSTCGIQFNDGAQCGSCGKQLDFGCANISESGWRKLGNERRASWKCSSCRGSQASPRIQNDPITIEAVMKEIKDLKRQLCDLPALFSEVKSLREEIHDIKTSCEFMSNKMEDYTKKLEGLENRITELESMKKSFTGLQADVANIKSELAANDQRTRLNNVEIRGIPEKRSENLFKIVEAIGSTIKYNFPKSMINYISRVPTYNSKEKVIIMSFINRYVKEEFIAAARAEKSLSTSDLGYENAQRIYVNDHLSSESKKLLNKTKVMAKEKKYKFVWVRFGKIHVRKDIDTRPLVVNRDSDLNKVV